MAKEQHLRPLPSHEAGFDERLVQALRRITRAVDLHSRKLASMHNITGPQLTALLTLSRSGPLTVSALGKALFLSNSTVVGIVDRLEVKQLVQRERSQVDRRQVLVAATEEGRTLAASAPYPLQDQLAGRMALLLQEEREGLALALEQLAAMMEVEPEIAPPAIGE